MSITDRPMKVGLRLPTSEKDSDDPIRWSDIRDIATLAEDVGFDSLWVVDHFLYQLEGAEEPDGLWEAWSLISALAACTRRVELGTLVLCMGFRNPALLAKMADTVEEISGGRLILGVGAGYHELEYRAFGFPYDHRYSRFEEALHIVHGLLRNGEIDYVGKFYEARDCVLRPRGPRPEGPPIMIGTTGHKMLRLTAKYADMWNAYWTSTHNSPSGVAPLRKRIDEACQEVGRDPATLQRTVTVLTADADADPWWNALPTGHDYEAIEPLSGTPAEIAEGLMAYHREGIAHVQISVDQISTAAIERLAPALELLRKAG
jgi:alkanesulfonate monooxygenase SsuD/methylene tetrahydromethanopterin reductase-like flavin-dependent oxidoreductase (luciferase family)